MFLVKIVVNMFLLKLVNIAILDCNSIKTQGLGINTWQFNRSTDMTNEINLWTKLAQMEYVKTLHITKYQVLQDYADEFASNTQKIEVVKFLYQPVGWYFIFKTVFGSWDL